MTTEKKSAAKTAGKIEIQFNGEPHHKLVAGGQEIMGGKTALVDADTAEMLLAAPWANVTLADKKTPQWPHTSEELDKIAEKLGVELHKVPAGGGEPEPTISDKIAALEAAGHTPADA